MIVAERVAELERPLNPQWLRPVLNRGGNVGGNGIIAWQKYCGGFPSVESGTVLKISDLAGSQVFPTLDINLRRHFLGRFPLINKERQRWSLTGIVKINRDIRPLFRISGFDKFHDNPIRLADTNVRTLRRMKRIHGIVIKPVVDAGIDAQNYQRNYLDDETAYFKRIMAFVVSVTMISVGWYRIRCNRGSMRRALIGGLITVLGWLPLW